MMESRAWWRNCGVEPDGEILSIDRLEDELSPLHPDVSAIRELISRLEMCHHKAERWVENIIQFIAAGSASKVPGDRPPDRIHPIETLWQEVCAGLSDWCAGLPAKQTKRKFGGIPASSFLTHLDSRSPLKEWQIQRVIEKIRSFIHWPQSESDPSTQYVGIVECGSGYESQSRTVCPDRYKEHEVLWAETVRTVVPNALDWKGEPLSLAFAIDLLMPCHWNFLENLEIVIQVIGEETPERSYVICGCAPQRNPIRPRMNVVSNTLRAFYQESAGDEIDDEILTRLGEINPVKKWLAASLDKTIRLQLAL